MRLEVDREMDLRLYSTRHISVAFGSFCTGRRGVELCVIVCTYSTEFRASNVYHTYVPKATPLTAK